MPILEPAAMLRRIVTVSPYRDTVMIFEFLKLFQHENPLRAAPSPGKRKRPKLGAADVFMWRSAA
jgi:hypothetical protein